MQLEFDAPSLLSAAHALIPAFMFIWLFTTRKKQHL